jgi:hypothetical protein
MTGSGGHSAGRHHSHLTKDRTRLQPFSHNSTLNIGGIKNAKSGKSRLEPTGGA